MVSNVFLCRSYSPMAWALQNLSNSIRLMLSQTLPQISRQNQGLNNNLFFFNPTLAAEHTSQEAVLSNESAEG